MGYPGRWSACPGTPVDFMVTSTAGEYTCEIIRITGRGPRPDGDGPPLSFEPVPSDVTGTYPGRAHQTVSGSYGVADGVRASPHGEGALAAWVYPTLPGLGRWQAVLTWLGQDGRPALELGIDETGRPAVRHRRETAGPGLLRGERPLAPRRWHYLAASVSPASSRVTLAVRERGNGGPATVTTRQDAALAGPPLGFRVYLAARGPGPLHTGALTSVVDGSYNGKIDAAAAWPGETLPGEGQAGPGALDDVRYVNSPMRRATGPYWSGRTLDWRTCPAEYGAVWYHDDDLADAGWPAAFRWQIPPGTRSGMYAARLSARQADGAAEDVISFYVRPPAGRPTAPLAVLVPTFTYTIYANFYHPAWASRGPEATEDEAATAFLGEHTELGLSLYCKHRDGSGVAHVSSRRPMLDMRPWHRIITRGNAGRELSGDLYLLDWLEHEGIGYDVITDDDLHAEGAALLTPYAGVITGGHPEYVSEQILDALTSYTDGGGNLAYLGGNGFYWVTTVADGEPHLLEVRRGRSGSRTWTGEPGEGHHTTGEPGGHWRDRGRAPQLLTGVGFCAQGGGPGAGYHRTAASEDPRVAFVFDGIGRGEVIGDFGLKLGGAAGDELDRADDCLGTPPGTLVLASSRGGHDDSYQRAVEEVEEMSAREGGTRSPEVRADMTYRQTPGGGCVFSVGSIAWTASLSHAGYRNNVARLTGNVLREFVRRGPNGGADGGAVDRAAADSVAAGGLP
jgi:N,N-dimethylformamidase